MVDLLVIEENYRGELSVLFIFNFDFMLNFLFGDLIRTIGDLIVE